MSANQTSLFWQPSAKLISELEFFEEKARSFEDQDIQRLRAALCHEVEENLGGRLPHYIVDMFTFIPYDEDMLLVFVGNLELGYLSYTDSYGDTDVLSLTMPAWLSRPTENNHQGTLAKRVPLAVAETHDKRFLIGHPSEASARAVLCDRLRTLFSPYPNAYGPMSTRMGCR